MTVRDLRDYLNAMSEYDLEYPVVVKCGDHELREVEAEITQAERSRTGEYYEFFTVSDMFRGSTMNLVLLLD